MHCLFLPYKSRDFLACLNLLFLVDDLIDLVSRLRRLRSCELYFGMLDLTLRPN